ncbi:MAG: helix-turn-helix transcriptional regulator [Bacteroidetes bacterium]|nr:helix-turn-helix transcriptional regulator [Bacteroidota bacterium]
MPLTPKQKDELKRLGARVKALREERQLTLKELAYQMDKDPQSISRLETGGVNPSYLYLQEICAGLEISMHELCSF